jgi:hypothetical protein
MIQNEAQILVLQIVSRTSIAFLLACNRHVAFLQGKVKDLIACNGYVAFFQETFQRTLLLAIGVLLSSMKDFEEPHCLLATSIAVSKQNFQGH